MIRIDLGKEELTGKSKKAFFGNITLPDGFPTLRKLQTNVRATMTIAGAIAVAGFLPLFFKQYRQFVISQHEDKMKAMNSKQDEIAQQITKLVPFQRELESYQQQQKIISDRLTVVRLLLDARNTPVNVLDAVGQSVPARAWVSNLEFSLVPENPSLRLEGKGYTNEDVSDFVDKLSESVYLADINLNDVVSVKLNAGVEVKSFTINAKPKVNPLPPFPKAPVVAKAAPPAIPAGGKK